MPTYTVKQGDQSYRKVNIRSTSVPKYEDVPPVGQTITYSDNLVVLEVLRQDGSSELYYEGPVYPFDFINSGDRFGITAVPTERLWIRKTDGTGIPYKIPSGLPDVGGRLEVLMPSGTQGFEVFGDKYFEKVFEQQQK